MVRWHEYGVRSGTPVVYFHGTPGTGVEACVLHATARREGVRIIAPDRPGMGFHPGGRGSSLESAPEDFVRLLDRAGVERAGILAWSGGGPFALACLGAEPNRASGMALLAPAGLEASWPRSQQFAQSMGLVASSLLAKVPGIPHVTARALFWGRRLPQLRRSPSKGSALPTWATPSNAFHLMHAWRTSLRQGAKGALHDNALILADWTHLVERAAPSATAHGVDIEVWHGDKDSVVPVEYSRGLAPQLGAALHELPGVGHHGVFIQHGPEALAFLASRG